MGFNFPDHSLVCCVRLKNSSAEPCNRYVDRPTDRSTCRPCWLIMFAELSISCRISCSLFLGRQSCSSDSGCCYVDLVRFEKQAKSSFGSASSRFAASPLRGGCNSRRANMRRVSLIATKPFPFSVSGLGRDVDECSDRHLSVEDVC